MKNLLYKELKLASSPLAFIFIAFALMAFIPGYPILLAGFFVCLGIFQSYQLTVENNDVLYTALLPIRKKETVMAKYISAVAIQMISFVLMVAFTLIRMNLLAGAGPYVENPLMNANPFFLGGILLVFSCFNWFFIGGFFKTAHKYGMPFLWFGVTTFVVIGIGETIHHIPGLDYFNYTGMDCKPILWIIMAMCMVAYCLVTWASCKMAQKNFEKIDL